MNLVYLGLGSNIGDREAMIQAALHELDHDGLSLIRTSSVYETEPVGLTDQRWFLNVVAEIQTDLFPVPLLRRTQRIESQFGRLRTLPNGPRTLDIDILLYGSVILKMADIELPHPRYRERRFTLAPLAELSPELRDPVSGRTVTELLAALNGQIIRRM